MLYEGSRVIIEKAGTEAEALLVPKESAVIETEKRMKLVKETFGIMRDIPLKKFTDDRIRGKRAKAYLETIRKGNV